MSHPSSIENLEFVFLGQSYKIRCPKENQVLLEKGAELLQGHIDSLAKKGTPVEKQAIMASLLLAFDIQRQKQELRGMVKELNDVHQSLLQLDIGSDGYDLIDAQTRAMQI